MDLEELFDLLSEQPLAYEPGSSWRYSFATDVCARLVEVISGKPFDVFLQERIFDPLNMKDTGFWVPEAKINRFISIYSFEFFREWLFKLESKFF